MKNTGTFIAKAAWGVGIIYLVLSATLSVDVLVRGKSPYLLPALWGGMGISFSPLSVVVLYLGRSHRLSRAETTMAQLPLLVFGLTALMAFVVIGFFGLSPD